jgi:hypothetical protein
MLLRVDLRRQASALVGIATTEAVYRKQIRPVLIEGAGAMDRIFPAADSQA